MQRRSGSVGLAPELLHAGNCLITGHHSDLGAGEVQPRDQQVREVGRQRLGLLKLRSPAVWLYAFAGACPEGGLIHVKLVAEGGAPDARPVRASLSRLGYSRSQVPAA